MEWKWNVVVVSRLMLPDLDTGVRASDGGHYDGAKHGRLSALRKDVTGV
jgi:hypothetical protein